MIFISLAPGWGPGLPLLSFPWAMVERHLLWMSRISSFSFSVTPLFRGVPLQLGPWP